MEKPEVTIYGVFDMQGCVPAGWNDEQVLDFANTANPSGTNTWFIRKQEDKALNGADERVECSERAGFVHIMLDA